MRKLLTAAVAATALAGLAGGVRADAAMGTLTCKIGDPPPGQSTQSMSFFLFSQRPVTCTYEGQGGTQAYVGTTGILLGFDLEYIQEGEFTTYAVMGNVWGPDALEGFYVGAKVGAKLGLGPNVQFGFGGGGDGSVQLIPAGAGGGFGLGASGGLAYLKLTKTK
jgi:hypothetical protein